MANTYYLISAHLKAVPLVTAVTASDRDWTTDLAALGQSPSFSFFCAKHRLFVAAVVEANILVAGELETTMKVNYVSCVHNGTVCRRKLQY